MKVYVVGKSGLTEYHNLIPESKIADSYKNADLVIFRGGDDISPSFYKQKKSLYCGNTDYARDVLELAIFKECAKKGIPMFGICRGLQLLGVANGHMLWQHVTHHTSKSHSIILDKIVKLSSDGNYSSFTCNSDHHQMIRFNPLKDNYQLLGYAPNTGLSDMYVDQNGVNDMCMWPKIEPEIVFFPQTKSLGIQAHPEWEHSTSIARKITLKLIEKNLFSA